LAFLSPVGTAADCHRPAACAPQAAEIRSQPGARRVNYIPMAKKIGLLFAGQGAQTVAMGKDLADEFPVAAEMFGSADAILARKLTDVTWNGPIEELTKTSNCQPALFVHGLACFAVLRELAGDFPVGGAAGLSLGEMTAHSAAGTFDFENALKLVQKRGEFMDEACAETFGGMAAMIGGLENDVRQ